MRGGALGDGAGQGYTAEQAWIADRIRELGPWFQNMDLRGVPTAPEHFLGDYPQVKYRAFSQAIAEDLTGRSVLEIGCNAGFYAFEMKRRNAERVVAIDSDDDYLAQARFAAEINGLDVEFIRLSVYDVAELNERFDIVLFMGVLYHLRHPLLALDLIHAHAARGILVFQSMLRGSAEPFTAPEDVPFTERAVFDAPNYPKLHFVERRYADDPTNWWIPNRSAAEAMLRSAGFEPVLHPEEEVFICMRRDLPRAPDGPYAVYPSGARR